MVEVRHEAAGEKGARQPRVVMLLLNPFEHDTRVYKQARSLLEWGCEVHVVALTKPGLPADCVVDGIRVHRVDAPRRDLWRTLAAWRVWRRGGPAVLEALRRDVETAPPVPSPDAPPTGDDAAASRVGGRRILPHFALPPLHEPCVVDWARRRRRALHDDGRGGAWVALLDGAAVAWRGGHAALFGSRRTGPGPGSTRGVLPWAHAAGRAIGATGRLALRGGRASMRALRRLGGAPVRAVRDLKHSALRPVSLNAVFALRAIDLAPDVVEAHDLNTLLAGVLAKRVLDVPLVYDSHELWLERNIGDRVRWWDKAGWAPIESFCIRRCDAVMTVAEGICRHLERQYGLGEVVLLRNVQPWEPPAPRTNLLADELGLDPAVPIVLYPGAITINRGLEQLIDAAARIERGVVVVMGYAGNADYGAGLVERARANGTLGRTVFFRDAVPVQDVSRYVASAALGVVPTQGACLSYRFESSNKIFHCLMAGVPIVASDHPEKRILVERWGIGRLFDERDPLEIARVIDETLADGEALSRMRRRCLEAARELNWEHEEHRLRTVFKRLLGDAVGAIPPPRLPCEIESVRPLEVPA